MVRKPLLLLVFSICFYAIKLSAKPEQVLTGVYLMNLYDLNLDDNSFYADFYIWFKWKGEIDPTGIEFVNMVEKWGTSQAPFEDSTILLAGGWKYQGYRVEGRFFFPFRLEHFPLDRHDLEIQVEHPDHPMDALVYVKDTTTPPVHVRPELDMAGWQLMGTQLSQRAHNYGTNFGNPDYPAANFSQFNIQFSIKRPVSYFLLKLLLPLTIVLLSAIGALLFYPSYVDARISLPVGSLLTAVFLQQSYSSALPDVGYMVLMDKIYLLAYAIIAAVMFQLILTGNKLRLFKKKEIDLARLKKREHRKAATYLAIYIFGTLLLVFGHQFFKPT